MTECFKLLTSDNQLNTTDMDQVGSHTNTYGTIPTFMIKCWDFQTPSATKWWGFSPVSLHCILDISVRSFHPPLQSSRWSSWAPVLRHKIRQIWFRPVNCSILFRTINKNSRIWFGPVNSNLICQWLLNTMYQKFLYNMGVWISKYSTNVYIFRWPDEKCFK